MSKISDFLNSTLGIEMKRDAATGKADALMAAILLLAAQSDGSISPAESAELERLISDKYAHSDEESVQHAGDSAERIPEYASSDELIAAANEGLSLQQKEDLMEMVLQIIAADERKAPGELALLDELVDGLNIVGDVMDRAYVRYFAARKRRDT